MVEEPLKASVNAVLALVIEEPEELRSRDETVLVCRPEEFEVSILKSERRPVRPLGSNESRKTTTERSRKSGGGDRKIQPIRRGVRWRNGFESGFKSGSAR